MCPVILMMVQLTVELLVVSEPCTMDQELVCPSILSFAFHAEKVGKVKVVI